MLFVGDILATGYDAVRKADCNPGDVAVVVGAGPVGLCADDVCSSARGRHVVADRHGAGAAGLAKEIGAIAVNAQENAADDVVLGT